MVVTNMVVTSVVVTNIVVTNGEKVETLDLW